MGKFFGEIGYVKTNETSPDIWKEETYSQNYYGDVLENVGLWRSSVSINDDVDLNCEISIIADHYALENYPYIKYVVYNGVKWKVKNVRPRYPRIILRIGGVYNG